MDLETLYTLVEEGRKDEASDFVLDIYYEDENPMETIVRVAIEAEGGDPPPVSATQVARIDDFLLNVDKDRLDLGVCVGIIMFSTPFKDELVNLESFVNYYNSRFADVFNERPRLAYSLANGFATG